MGWILHIIVATATGYTEFTLREQSFEDCLKNMEIAPDVMPKTVNIYCHRTGYKKK